MRIARVAVPAPLYPLDTLLDYAIPDELRDQVSVGSLVEIPLGRRSTTGVVFAIQHESDIESSKLRSLVACVLPDPVFSPERLQLLRWLSQHYLFPLGEVAESCVPSCVREASEKILKKSAARKIDFQLSESEASPPLNAAQAAALAGILKANGGEHLLWGVTGSGKTEVYLQLIASAIEKGQGALVLVPEIALTPQVQARFERRFPGQVAVFHSAQKPTQLREAWLQTLRGERRIAVGARSALFAPVQNLGIVIIDEEHDGSYKQEERLRYHAREAARQFTHLSKIPVVMGSATPSAESLHRVREGHMKVWRLPERAVTTARLPAMKIVDLRKHMSQRNFNPEEMEKHGIGVDSPRQQTPQMPVPEIRGDFFLTPELRAGLEETLAAGEQAILFLNRRGVGSQELCRHCGHSLNCPSCDVSLSPHLRKLMCHYCGYEQGRPTSCPQCKAADEPFIQVGVGTEAIQDAVKFHFPQARVLRLDRDSTASRGDLEEILGAFSRGQADVLVGTQMVAKGHDFPNVTLVGILLAELGLSMPDFRAYERQLQLLLQIAGRAGRADKPGQVLLQTFNPEHPVLSAFREQRGLDDYARFLDEEITKRRLLRYPPNGELALLRFDGLTESEVRQAAQTVAQALKRAQSESLQILGPVSSPLSRIRGRYRWQLIVKGRQESHVNQALSWILDGWHNKKLERKFKTRLQVDVDPVNML